MPTTRKKKYIRKKKYTRKGGKNIDPNLLKIFGQKGPIQRYNRKVINKTSLFDPNRNVTYNPVYRSSSNKSRSKGSSNRPPSIPANVNRGSLRRSNISNRTISLKSNSGSSKRDRNSDRFYVSDSSFEREWERQKLLKQNNINYEKAQRRNVKKNENVYATFSNIINKN